MATDLLLDVEMGKIIAVEPAMAQAMELSWELGDLKRVAQLAEISGISQEKPPGIASPEAVPVRSISLAIAQKCNLGCTYCYAEQGTFGGIPSNMSLEVAKASVDQLIHDASPGEKVTVAFMGGEPLFNRSAIHDCTRYAAEKAIAANVGISFAMTTNATLIRPEDVTLFQEFRFSLTVSIDGLEGSHDALRPFLNGKGSFTKVREKLDLLLGYEDRKFAVLARITVTPKNLDLQSTFMGLVQMGFDSITFSPLVNSSTGKGEMKDEQLSTMLEQLISCGESFMEGVRERKLRPLGNAIKTLKRIHEYQREMYPCGAGGGYMGVSAEGGMYACHRFVNDEKGSMGDVFSGLDQNKQTEWLSDRDLQNQTPCTVCWARYLCNGSCHHEVIHRGRPSCDYIRGWLHYCLGIYAELASKYPEALQAVLYPGQRVAQ